MAWVRDGPWVDWYVKVVQPTMQTAEIRNTPLHGQTHDVRSARRKKRRRQGDKQTIIFPVLEDGKQPPALRRPNRKAAEAVDICMLPPELLCHIFSFLELYDMLPIASVCCRWNETVDDIISRRRQITMEDLSFKKRIFVTDLTLRRMLSRLPKLRVLIVDGRHLKSLDVNIVSSHCRLLQTLDLFSYIVSKSTMLRLCRSCPRLSELVLPPECGDCLAGLAVRNLRCLRSLRLNGVVIESGRWLAELPPTMEDLSLVSCHVDDSSPLVQARMPHLQQLDLSWEMYFCWREMGIALSHWSALQKLDVSHTSIPNEVVRRLPDLLPELRHLNVSGCSNLTVWGVGRLHLLRKLQWLNVLEIKQAPWSVVVAASTSNLFAGLERIASLTMLTIGKACPSSAFSLAQVTPCTVQRLILALPHLKTLVVYVRSFGKGRVQFVEGVRNLHPRLPSGRQVTIKVFGTSLEEHITFISGSNR